MLKTPKCHAMTWMENSIAESLLWLFGLGKAHVLSLNFLKTCPPMGCLTGTQFDYKGVGESYKYQWHEDVYFPEKESSYLINKQSLTTYQLNQHFSGWDWTEYLFCLVICLNFPRILLCIQS